MSMAASDYELACAYETGTDDLPQSNDEFVKYLKKSADGGHSVAQNWLSRLYRRGFGLKPDQVEAERYARLSAAQDYLPAIGICYEYGYGVDKDESIAFDMYIAAHRNGDLDGTLFAGLHGNTRPDLAGQSFALLDYGASQNNVRCMFEAGVRYAIGYGVDRDDSKAFDLFQRAANLGSVDAYNRLGNAYFGANTSVKYDRRIGVYWLRLAARQSNANSMYHLGRQYLFGFIDDSNTIDIRNGVRWLTKSSDIGNRDACLLLGQILEFGSDRFLADNNPTNKTVADPDFVVGIDLRKAVELYRSAADTPPGEADMPPATAALRRLRRY